VPQLALAVELFQYSGVVETAAYAFNPPAKTIPPNDAATLT
jgi:hypothetical protein